MVEEIDKDDAQTEINPFHLLFPNNRIFDLNSEELTDANYIIEFNLIRTRVTGVRLIVIDEEMLRFYDSVDFPLFDGYNRIIPEQQFGIYTYSNLPDQIGILGGISSDFIFVD